MEEFCKFHKTANKLKDVPYFFISDDFEQYPKVISDLSNNLLDINKLKSEILDKVKEKFIEEKTSNFEKTVRETSFLARVFSKGFLTK